ncbi:MAG: NINE protein [Chloroflexota bacterium]
MQPTIKCPFCGALVTKSIDAQCERCGMKITQSPTDTISDKFFIVALLLAIFPVTGLLGGHRWYTGKNKSALLFIVTLGGFTIWWVLDIISIALNLFRDSKGRLLNRQKTAHFIFIFFFLALIAIPCLSAFLGNISNNKNKINETINPNSDITQTSTTTLTHTPSPSMTPTPLIANGTIAQNNINMRSAPGLTAVIITTLKINLKIVANAKSQDDLWVLVNTENQDHGWVYKELIKFSEETALLPISKETIPTLVPTIPPTATLIPAIELDKIYLNLETKTVLQFQQYSQAIVGKPVRETIKIGNVDKQGRVIIHGVWSPELFNISDFCVVMTGMSEADSIQLTPGQDYPLNATIQGIIGNYNYYNNCEYTLILNYIQ